MWVVGMDRVEVGGLDGGRWWGRVGEIGLWGSVGSRDGREDERVLGVGDGVEVGRIVGVVVIVDFEIVVGIVGIVVVFGFVVVVETVGFDWVVVGTVGSCFVGRIVGFVFVGRTVDVEQVVVDIAEPRFVTGIAEPVGNFEGMVVVEVAVAGYFLDWHWDSIQIGRVFARATYEGMEYVVDCDQVIEIVAS
jgi:hypothetical protein